MLSAIILYFDLNWLLNQHNLHDLINSVCQRAGKRFTAVGSWFQSPCLLCLADVDECGEQSSCCEQDCTNYPGGYECYCSAGYRLNPDGCSCDGMFNPLNVDGSHTFMRLNIYSCWIWESSSQHKHAQCCLCLSLTCKVRAARWNCFGFSQLLLM